MAKRARKLDKVTRLQDGAIREDAVSPGEVKTVAGGGRPVKLFDQVNVKEGGKDFFYNTDAHPSWHKIILNAIRNKTKVKVKFGAGTMDGYREATSVKKA